jgi:hypothetical protein
MKSKKLIFIIITTLGLCVSSCYWRNWETLHPSPVTAPCPIDTGTVMSFSINVQPIINSKCAGAGCHDNSGTLTDFTIYGDATNGTGFVSVCGGDTVGSGAWQDITGQSGNQMPKVGSPQLTPCEKKAIRNWIHQGAQNN